MTGPHSFPSRHRLTSALLSVAASSVIATSPVESQTTAGDSSRTRQTVAESTARFLARWRVEWLASDWEAWVGFQDGQGQRSTSTFKAAPMQHFSCIHAWAPPLGLADPARMYNRIGSASRLPSLICPSWTVEDRHYADASSVLDSALSPARRDRVVMARDSLLQLLAGAATALPGDGWITGQRVRFLIDQSHRRPTAADDALKVARACHAERWLCESLVGYVFARQRLLDSAAAAFARARSVSSAALQCEMSDILVLADRKAVPREFVPPASCGERVALSARYWWLADPLWSDAINERRVEHDARTVSLLLATGLPRGERFDWRVADGGDAAAQLVTRYGWPSRMLWSPINQSRLLGERPNLLEIRYRNGIDPFAAAPSPPFTTQDYNVGRVHVGPSWTALISPYTSRASDWEFSAPASDRARRWWPSEHMQRDRGLIAIAEWQEQYWRRADSIVLAVAARVPQSLSTTTKSVGVHLLRSRGPDATAVVAERIVAGDSTVTLSGLIPADSTVLSLELTGHGVLRSDARVRFAALTPTTLRTMSPGDVALSAPALFQARSDGERIGSAESAVRQLLPSTTLRSGRRIGLFWESYGFSDRDEVDITVQVHRLDSPGRFERIAASLGLREPESTGTEIRWREPHPGTLRPFSGTVPIHGRSVMLNLAGLRAGDYVVAVSMRTNNGRSASSVRHFQIE